MKIIELSVKRPIATGVIYVFVCVAGIFAWTQLPQEVMPDLNFPQLTIVTNYPQAAPQEIENLVTKPIEEAVGTVKNVNRVKSVSKEGTSIVTIEFSWGTNMDFASLNTREKLDLVKSRLPSDVREPMVIKYNPFYTPILILSLNAEGSVDSEFLSHIAQKTVANKFQKVEGVAAVQLSGTVEKEIQVDLDQDRLAANRVSILQFNQSLAKANYKGAAGTAKEGSYDYSVRVVSPFDSVEDIRNAIVAMDNPTQQGNNNASMKSASLDRQRQRAIHSDQRLIPVSNLGTVKEGFRERSSYSRYDGKENITIMIQKQATASTLKTASRLKEAITDIQPLLPSDVSLTIIYDQAKEIKKGINDVLHSAIEGGLLAFIILYIFLNSWRDAGLVSVVIPVSVLITCIVMKMAGMSLNMISMGGLALGLGHLVDAAICVTENIHRRRIELGEDLESAVIQGTSEVSEAVTSSILTSVAVFLPLLFVSGLIGQLFRDLSLTVTISQLVSLLLALTLVPMLAKVTGDQELQKQDPAQRALSKGEMFMEKLKEWYLPKLHYSFEHPRRVWGFVLVLFFVSILVLKIIPSQFLPHVDANELTCKLTMPNGTGLDRTDQVTRVVEKIVQEEKSIDHMAVTVGSSSDSPLVLLGKHESKILITLKKKRKHSADEITDELRNKIATLDLKGGRMEIEQGGGSLSAMQGASAPLMIYLKGYDLVKLKKASESLIEKFSAVPGIVQVRDSLSLPSPEIRLNINKERAARAGLSVTDIGQTAMSAYYGKDVTQIYKEGKEIQIRVRLAEKDRANISQLRTLLLPAGSAGTLPLQDVSTVDLGEGPSQIDRMDQERVVLIRGDHGAGYSMSSGRKVQKLMDQFAMQDISLELAGEKKAEKESFFSLFGTLFISVLLVFMVMAVQFESIKQPFLILFTIPMSVIGMAMGLFMMGKTLNAISGMGLLLLAGIVVNNGIVLIDFVNSERHRGVPLKEALIQGCQTRLRPILLTAIATIVGMIPLALGIGEGAELQSPMAVTVIFGLGVSTILTLVALPTLFLYVEKSK